MFHRILKWVLWLTGLLLTMLILVAAGLFFTPNMVSTDWFRHQFETRASNALKRQVTVKELQWTWKEGIKIEGLEAIDAPEYAQAPILSIDYILFSFDFQPTRKRLFIDLEVDGLRAHLIREKDGRTNLAAWLSQLKQPRETTEPAHNEPSKKKPTPFILPGDLEAKVQLSHAHIRVDDRMENRSLHIQDGTFKLEIPSLLSKPVTLVLSSRQEIDGKILPPLALTVHVNQLVNETHTLNPQTAIIQVNGEFPGLKVAVKGSLAQRGLEGKVAIDFIPLVKTVQAFLPNIIPQLSGRVLLQAKARSEKENAIAFDMVLSGEDILAAGGPLKEKQVGPLSFNISQKGSADLDDKAVTLAGGEIRFMEHCGLFWEGRIKMEEKAGADVNLTLRRVNFDLNEIQRLAKRFIPKDIHVTGLNNAGRPDFAINEIHLVGMLPKGEARLSIKDLDVNISSLDLALSERTLKVKDLTLQIPETTVQLKKLFPQVLEMRAELGVKKVGLSGKQSFFLEDGLTLKGHMKEVRLNQRNPLMLDVGGLEADIQSGDLLTLHLMGAAVDSGIKEFQMEGRLGVDLKQVMDLTPAALKPKGDFTGRVETEWRLQGRRPDATELAGLTDNGLPLEKRLQQMAFLEKLNLKTQFINMGITLPLKSGETLSVLSIHSPSPFEISLLDGMKSVLFEGKINLDKIQALPALGKLKPPQSAVFSVKGVGRDLNSLELWETFTVTPLAMEQTLELSLNKLNRLLRKKEKPDLTAILKLMEAKIQAGVSINSGPGLAPFSKGLTLKGPLKGRLELELRGGKTISAQTFLESEGLNVTLGPKFTLNNLKTHLQLEKTYDLAFGPPIVSRENTKALSRTVLQPGITSRPDLGFNNSLSQRLVEDLRGRLSRKPSLSFDSAWLASGPFPMEINNAQLQMRLNPSLPSVDYFQMDIMGGTLLGELGIYERNDLYFLHMDGAFSGLDVETRHVETRHALSLRGRDSEDLPNQKAGGEDTRISGQLSLEMPMDPNTRTVMNNVDAVFRLTHIGPRTLERLLYAMDPHENNESIVKQRALLRKGTPRWIEVAIRHGNLSLTGDVTVGGSTIHLPPIKRLNVTALPIQKRIQNLANTMVPLVKGLKILSADTLRVDQGGGIDFTEASQ